MIIDPPSLVGNATTVVESVRSVQVVFNMDEQFPWLRYAFFAISIATGIIVALATGAIYMILSKRIASSSSSSSRRKRQQKGRGGSSDSGEEEEEEEQQLDPASGPRDSGASSYFMIRTRTAALEEENRIMRKRLADLEARLAMATGDHPAGLAPAGTSAANTSAPVRRGGSRENSNSNNDNASAIVWSGASQQRRGGSPSSINNSSNFVFDQSQQYHAPRDGSSSRYIVRGISNPRM